ncbi:1,4-alpha-glucan branching protein domain-containing protein [Treponema sp.]|uniref:1,4-alpha-glucan branching protein domain-containing protein n=1 Tax=Treponema sp. TaxID=166 RepID=UPI0025D66888|nr:1,4-alpha-glucan branching protein domain-containing protein [Treponema sp.]MCR5219165.1 DUF1957 domain-containing protein [Treponema sp.]
MNDKNLVLIINAHQGYIRNIDDSRDFSAENELLFSALTSTYIPLADLFNKLADEKIDFKIGLVLSSTLCSLLSDPVIIDQYENFINKSIELGNCELLRLKNLPEAENAKECLKRFNSIKESFVIKYHRNLLEQFKILAQKGYLELIPTAATYAYLPHYQDLTEAINAQVETGLYSQKYFFGDTGEGFYIPYLGWSNGLEKILKPYGINYTVVDPRSLLFSSSRIDTGIFRPVRTNNSLAIFAADPDGENCFTDEEGFISNPVYLSVQKDIGFELEDKDLSVLERKSNIRTLTGYRYWCNVEDEDEYEDAPLYNKDAALEQVKKDAAAFVNRKTEKLTQAMEYIKDDDAVLVCPLSAELFGQKWAEGIDFLEEVIRLIFSQKKIKLNVCQNLIEKQYTLPKAELYPCSGDDSGYGEDLLDITNSWMIRYVKKAAERMIDLTERLPSETSLKGRMLNLAAKEILLSQSGEWPAMLHSNQLPDYIKEKFKTQILSFTTIYDSLASNSVSTQWLTEKEKEDCLYPWMNYRIFSRKK